MSLTLTKTCPLETRLPSRKEIACTTPETSLRNSTCSLASIEPDSESWFAKVRGLVMIALTEANGRLVGTFSVAGITF